ncbi:MAG TPA: HlyD family secretion protein [Terracidiphilus sp.]|nr:HlyD family secretion protein [Terracidiphilus sp.]
MSNNSNASHNSHGVLLEEGLPENVADRMLDTPGTEKKLGRPGRRTKLVVIAAAALLLAAVGAWFLHNAWLHEDTDDAQVDGHIMPLSTRITGHVQQVNVIEGQMVHAGDVLVIIDPSDYKVAAKQAKASLANAEAIAAGSRWNLPIASASAWSDLDSARAGVQNAEAGVGAAGQELESAKAQLAAAEANAQKTDADLIRYTQLVTRQDVSRQQYDQAVAAAKANRAAVIAAGALVRADEQTLEQAHGRLLQARAALDSARTAPDQVSLAHAKYNAADAQVEWRKAELDQAELNLSYTIIRSPVSGIVGKRSAEVGENVSVGQELIDVVPLDDIWITADFKETQLARMRPGDPVEIKVDAYGRSWRGHVTNLGGGTGSVFSLLPPENATGNYVKVVQRVPVRIDFDRSQAVDFNAEGLLKPGLSVDPEVTVR